MVGQIMIILGLLLAVNAVLHVLIVYRFGAKENVPFLVFAVIYAALAIGVFLGAPYILWLTLIPTAIGLVGQTVTLNRLKRDKTIDWAIEAADAATLLCTLYLLFAK
jgi:hypothetical protein